MNDSPEELQQRIAAYIDGELSPAEAARLEVYLANTDPALADEVVGMLSDKVQIRALPRVRAPGELAGRVMEQIERGSLLQEGDRVSSAHGRWWNSRLAIAAGLAIVLGGFGYLVVSSVLTSGGTNPWHEVAGGKSPRAEPVGPPAGLSKAGPTDKSPVPEALPQKDEAAAPAASKADGVIPAPVVAEKGAASTAPAMALAQADGAAGTAMTLPQAMNDVRRPETQIASAEPSRVQQDIVGGLGGFENVPRGGGGGGGAGAVGGRGGRGRGGAVAGGGGAGGGGGFAGGGGAGGGAGGGRRGGGGGGFGGGGRGAGPAVAGATPEAQPAAQVQTVAPTTDNALQAVAALTKGTSTNPVILTLWARDEQDYGRLAGALFNYAGANSTARALDNSVSQANGLVLNQAGGQNDARAGTSQNGAAEANRAAATASPPAGAAGGQTPLNGSQVLSGQANIYAANNFNGTPTYSGVPVNSNGVILLDQPRPNYYANNVMGNTTNRAMMDNRVVGEPNNSLNAGGNSVRNMNDNLAQQQTPRAGEQSAQQVVSQGGPYRVMLRAEQLTELSRDFRFAVLARGEEAYLFRTIGDQAPATADRQGREGLLQRAGLNTSQGALVHEGTLRGMVATGADNNNDRINTPENRDNVTLEKSSQTGQLAGGGVPMAQKALQVEATSSPLIQCVVTMERAPSGTGR